MSGELNTDNILVYFLSWNAAPVQSDIYKPNRKKLGLVGYLGTLAR